MGKKTADPSLLGKKPANKVKHTTYSGQRNPSHIQNKLKRSELYSRYQQQKKQQKKQRLKNIKEAQELGEEVTKQTPKTIDNTREAEISIVDPNDPEIIADHADDEFCDFFNGIVQPKLLITTRPKPSKQLFYFIADLQKLLPNLHFYPRQHFSIKDIVSFAKKRDFTHLIVVSEKSKTCNGMLISCLHSDGPTAFFKLSNVVVGSNIPGHGAVTSHVPELNLHGFGTRLGCRVGRLLGSLFPPPVLKGRQVVTFHNQRDYIFVRQHRYIFKDQQKRAQQQLDTTTAPTAITESSMRANLQELGPRFTLKLRWLQCGTFDTQTGEYEFLHKRKQMDVTRRKFHL